MANEKISFDNLEEYDGYLRNDANILKRNTNYVEGNIVNKGQVFLKCTQSGRTKSTTLSLSGVSVGSILEDGAVKWEVVSINGIPQGSSIVDWKPNHLYKENDIFVSENQIYKVLVEFTSGSTFENIEILEDYEPEEWQPNTSYVIGDIFIESGVLYKVVNAFTSGTTFSVTSDIELYGEKEYQEGQEIITNDIVEYNGNYYKALIDFTCGKEFTKTAFEEYVPKSLTDEEIEEVIRSYTPEFSGNSGGSGLSIWEANKEYSVNDIVIDSNLIWQCIVAHTSTTTFDESKWICLSGGEISNGMEIVPLWEGDFSFSNSTEGATPTSSTPMIELNDPIQNYEYIYVATELGEGEDSHAVTVPVSLVDDIRIGMSATGGIYSTGTLSKYDNTHFYMKNNNTAGWQPANVVKICGIRKAKPIVSSGMKYETLWEGEVGSYGDIIDTTINLSDSANKYRKLGLTIVTLVGSDERIMYYEVNTSDYTNLITSGGSGDKLAYGWPGNTSAFFEINNNSTQNQLSIHCRLMKITKVVGVSEGVQIPTGVQAARVTLWEGFYNTSNQSYAITQTQEMSSMEGYDQIEITFTGRKAEEGDNIVTQVFNISDIQYNSKALIRLQCFATRDYYTSFNVGFTDSTHFGIAWLDATSWGGAVGITKITGIKYIQPDSYSTEEKLIGTWIDGKPLYRKVFENPTFPINAGLVSSSYGLKKLCGHCIVSNVSSLSIPYADIYNTVGLYCDISNGTVGLNSTDPNIIVEYVIVEYTKN